MQLTRPRLHLADVVGRGAAAAADQARAVLVPLLRLHPKRLARGLAVPGVGHRAVILARVGVHDDRLAG